MGRLRKVEAGIVPEPLFNSGIVFLTYLFTTHVTDSMVSAGGTTVTVETSFLPSGSLESSIMNLIIVGND